MSNEINVKKIKYRPRIVGEYSYVFTIPAWWMRVNERPKFLEVTITLDKLELRPIKDNEEVEGER